jgi:hypothetical protein
VPQPYPPLYSITSARAFSGFLLSPEPAWLMFSCTSAFATLLHIRLTSLSVVFAHCSPRAISSVCTCFATRPGFSER